MNAEQTSSFQDASDTRSRIQEQRDQREAATDIAQSYHNAMYSLMTANRAWFQFQEMFLSACALQARTIGEQLSQVEQQQRQQMRQRA